MAAPLGLQRRPHRPHRSDPAPEPQLHVLRDVLAKDKVEVALVHVLVSLPQDGLTLLEDQHDRLSCNYGAARVGEPLRAREAGCQAWLNPIENSAM